MSHELAKLLLERALTDDERAQAVSSAMVLGMPLHEIEDYLDWRDNVRRQVNPNDGAARPSPG